MLPIPPCADDLRSGQFRIELDHQQLVGLFDQALALFEAERLVAKDAFHALLNELAALVDRHFRSKEALARKNGCPSLAQQCTEHEAFREKLAGLLSDAYYGRAGKPALLELINEYFVEHSPCTLPIAPAACSPGDAAG